MNKKYQRKVRLLHIRTEKSIEFYLSQSEFYFLA